MTKLGTTYKYGTVQLIPLDKVLASPFQVRKRYGNIAQLARDIDKRGLLQPILVRPVKDNFEIVHGHRRWMAIKSLGRKYIECFVKELTDTEAILILGSENLQRKNFDPIEEGMMYKFYRDFKIKETGESLSLRDIAEAFETSVSNVEHKLGLLDLPESVQEKIIRGIIPVRKAQALITLTREPLKEDIFIARDKNRGRPSEPRTDRFYEEIEVIAGEIEKGSQGGLRTRKGIQMAVDAIQEGKTVNEALEEAKLKESIEIAKKYAEQGKKPEEIISEIITSQQDPQAVLNATITLNIKVIQKLLKSGTLVCPYCSKVDCLHWSCKNEAVINGDIETQS